VTFQTLTGLQYLKAEVACKWNKALEKKTWDERLAAFETINFDDPKTFKNASNPIGLRSAFMALQEVQSGLPTGYTISLDATSSGLQLLSLLVSCPDSWQLCGGNNSSCTSAYTLIYEAMNIGSKLTFKQVKNAIMTAFYGSSAIPERIFGLDLDVFYDTISDMAPGAWQLNLDLQTLWDMINRPDYEWVLPDNFHAHIETKVGVQEPFTLLGKKLEITKYVTGRPDFHKGLGPNLIHSVDALVVREMARRCMYKPSKIISIIELIQAGKTHGTTGASAGMVSLLWKHYKDTGFLSARILDYLYEDTLGLVDAGEILELIMSFPMKPFQIITNHDCFRCHPNYGNDIRRQYNRILADINDSTLLQSLVSQVARKPKKVRKYGHIDRNEVLHSNYALA
jgi:hypothetical protein